MQTRTELADGVTECVYILSRERHVDSVKHAIIVSTIDIVAGQQLRDLVGIVSNRVRAELCVTLTCEMCATEGGAVDALEDRVRTPITRVLLPE